MFKKFFENRDMSNPKVKLCIDLQCDMNDVLAVRKMITRNPSTGMDAIGGMLDYKLETVTMSFKQSLRAINGADAATFATGALIRGMTKLKFKRVGGKFLPTGRK